MNNLSKITKYLLLISILAFSFYFLYLKNNLLVFGTQTVLEDVSNSIVSVDEEREFFIDDKIIDILTSDEYSVFIGERTSYLVDEDIILKVNDIIKKFIFSKSIYMISNDTLYKYDFKELKKIYINKNISDFVINNDIIYICGEKENDAVIYQYSLNLNYLNEESFGGDGFESFVNINYINNKLYLIGEKDSTSFNSPFKNCGSKDTIKTFMIILNDNITEEVYFNFSNETETFKEVIYDEYIYLLLSNNQIICLDYNLNNIPIKKYNYPINSLILSIDKELLTFNYNNNLLYLNNQLFYQSPFKIVNITQKTGYLTIYFQDEEIIYEQVLFEYHIDKNEDLICSKYHYDLNTLDNLEVNSYFEKFKKEIKTYDPYLQKQIDGTYNIKYLISRTNNKSFLIDGKLIVQHFVNIINNGIYKVNKELSFFGKALLNGKEIYNGYIINEPGDYELTLENINHEIKSYYFKVVDNYYLDDLTVTYFADYLVNQNEQLDVVLELNNIKVDEIKEILVNNQKYDLFTIKDNQIFIHFMGKNYYSIDVYKINKIILKNNEEIIINKLITIKTLNKLPTIILHQTSKLGRINLDYQLIDNSKTIMYLKIEILRGDEIIKTYYNYFNNEKINYEEIEKNSIIKLYLGINDSININELLICEYQTDCENLEKLQQVDYKVDLSINNLLIDLETTNVKYEYLNVDNQNLISSLEIISALINYKTIIYITVPIFLFSFIYILIRKKIKNKKLNKLK